MNYYGYYLLPSQSDSIRSLFAFLADLEDVTLVVIGFEFIYLRNNQYY
jgi:hypothetical protein